jgi:hypothetical protein
MAHRTTRDEDRASGVSTRPPTGWPDRGEGAAAARGGGSAYSRRVDAAMARDHSSVVGSFRRVDDHQRSTGPQNTQRALTDQIADDAAQAEDLDRGCVRSRVRPRATEPGSGRGCARGLRYTRRQAMSVRSRPDAQTAPGGPGPSERPRSIVKSSRCSNRAADPRYVAIASTTPSPTSTPLASPSV